MVKKITYNDIGIYINEAKKHGLGFCKSTIMHGYFIDNKLVAFGGMIIYKHKCVFKNFYVPLEYRGKGYFKKLFNYQYNITKLLGLKKIEASCTDMSINYFMQNNFKVIKTFKNYKKVCNENI
jgi:N-acetylglutamate synthase-like GNAT family acetyltransferase